jgi:DNA-binding NtrC family response regulator
LFTAVLATPIMVDNQYYGTLNILTVGHQMLERLGYEVVATTSSSEALETFRTHPNTFDVVITDQIMPHVSDELAQELLRMQPNIPIILITGFSQLFGPEHAKNLGIRAYLEKPLAADDLGEAIRRVLNKASKEI